MTIIMVLNDGTTWTDIEGCTIAEVSDDYDEDHPLKDGKILVTLGRGYSLGTAE